VRFPHRLRFTADVLGAERHVLEDLLEPSDTRAARVQFFVDGHVAAAQPFLVPTLDEIAAAHPDRYTPAGAVRIVPGGEVVKNDPAHLEGSSGRSTTRTSTAAATWWSSAAGRCSTPSGSPRRSRTAGSAWSACRRRRWPRPTPASGSRTR
jgi:hypothetical protein